MRTLTSVGSVANTGIAWTAMEAGETIIPYYAFLPAGSIPCFATASGSPLGASTFLRWSIVGSSAYVGGASTDTVIWRLYYGATPGVSGTAIMATPPTFTQPTDDPDGAGGVTGTTTWRMTAELSSWSSGGTSSPAARVSMFMTYDVHAFDAPSTTARSSQNYLTNQNSDAINNTADCYLWWTVEAGTVTGTTTSAAYLVKTFHAWIDGEARTF